jgi:hypothetical protein
MPEWLPVDAQLYLAHVEQGLSMRRLARERGCHASSVMRQIRKLENRREDGLIDQALCRLGRQVTKGSTRLLPSARPPVVEKPMPPRCKKELEMNTVPSFDPPHSTPDLLQQALPVLQALTAEGHVLAVAADMEKAVIAGGDPAQKTVVARALAEALALQGWIECDAPGRVSRYRLSEAGRQLLQTQPNNPSAASGMAEAAAHFQGAEPVPAGATPLPLPRFSDSQRRRLAQGETPLALLARRRDKSGQPFLEEALVQAGERLREDYELAQLSQAQEDHWNPLRGGGADTAPLMGFGPEAARARTAAALRDLGPGLGDVVLRCCCYLEGLETAEKRMGWSARSGKIALQRLRQHYERPGKEGALIG